MIRESVLIFGKPCISHVCF